MIQPQIKKKEPLKTILLNFVFLIIPLVNVYVIVMAIIEITKTKMPIYENVPIRVKDRRHKDGYRIESWDKKRTRQKRELSKEELVASKYNGKLRLYGLVLFLIVGGVLYYFKLYK